MLQQEMNRHSKQQINAPFRAKSAGLSLIAVLVIGIYYFVNVLALLPGDDAIPDGAPGLALTAIVLIVVVEATLQIVLFIGAGKIEDRTERDDIVHMMSIRNAHFVLSAGVMLTVGSMFIGFTPFEMGNILLLAFLLAEVVKYASQLTYYRRSA